MGLLSSELVILPSLGAFGGILVIWDKQVVELMEGCLVDFMVACSFKTIVDGFRWAFAGVYSPNIG